MRPARQASDQPAKVYVAPQEEVVFLIDVLPRDNIALTVRLNPISRARASLALLPTVDCSAAIVHAIGTYAVQNVCTSRSTIFERSIFRKRIRRKSRPEKRLERLNRIRIPSVPKA